MSVENPTGSDSGASITDRLESFLSAGDSPDERKPKEQAAPAASDDADLPELDANADLPADPPAGDELENDDGPQLSTADLAKYFGVDEDALDVDADGSVLIKTKIDGKDGAAKFSDMLKSYQMQGHVDNRAREVAAQHQAIQQQAAAADQAIAQKLSQLDSVIAHSSNQLLAEFQNIDWNWLRANQPGEYSALVTDFNARKQENDSLMQRSAQAKAEIDARKSQQATERQEREMARLPSLIPEWRDHALANKERAEMLEFAPKLGFFADPNDTSLANAPVIAALRKAMLYDRLQSSKASVENKVRTAPKLVKAGQSAQVSRAQHNVRTLKNNIRSSGGKAGDVAAFLLATGKA